MLAEIKNIKSGRKELHDFGLLIGGILLIIAVAVLIKKGEFNYYLFVSGITLFSLGIIIPSVLLPLQKAWMTISIILGWIVSRIILAFLFYTVVTITGLLGRIFRKQFLMIKINQTKDTYWIKKEKQITSERSCEKMF